MRTKRPHQVYTFRCELSEGLAFKYLITCHLNQAHRQYVDSDVLAFKFFCQQLLPFYAPAIIHIFHVLSQESSQYRGITVE